ncbi:MAG: PilZ domain-containing protein [Desulfovibrionaceae bacterium]
MGSFHLFWGVARTALERIMLGNRTTNSTPGPQAQGEPSAAARERHGSLDMLFRLPVNARLALQPEGSSSLMWSVLFGVVRGRHVLVAPPASLAERDLLRVGARTQVRFLATGNTIGVFSTEVAWLSTSPAHVVFLGYPETIDVVSPRASVRALHVAPCQIAVGEIPWPAMMVDLSSGGCRVSVDEQQVSGAALQQGGTVAVRFAVPGMDNAVVAAGRIQSMRARDGKLAMGLQFVGLAEDVRHSLERFVLEAAVYAAA